MGRKFAAVGIATALMVGLVAGMFLLRKYGADGACGVSEAKRQVGSVVKIGGCR